MPDTKTYWPFGSGFFDVSLGEDSELEVCEVELQKFTSGSAIYYTDNEPTPLNVRLHVEGSIVQTLLSEFNVSEVCYHGDNIYEVTVWREALEARIAKLLFVAGMLALLGAALIFIGLYLGFTGHTAYATLSLMFFGAAFMLSAACIDTGAENLKNQMERTK